MFLGGGLLYVLWGWSSVSSMAVVFCKFYGGGLLNVLWRWSSVCSMAVVYYLLKGRAFLVVSSMV